MIGLPETVICFKFVSSITNAGISSIRLSVRIFCENIRKTFTGLKLTTVILLGRNQQERGSYAPLTLNFRFILACIIRSSVHCAAKRNQPFVFHPTFSYFEYAINFALLFFLIDPRNSRALDEKS